MNAPVTRPPWGIMLFIACVLFVSWSSVVDVPGEWRSVDVPGHQVLAACQLAVAALGVLLAWPMWTRRVRFAPLLFAWAALFVATGTLAASIYSPAPQRLMAGASAFAGSLIVLALVIYWPWRWLRRAAAPAAPDAA